MAMSPQDFTKWVPLATVMAAGGVLWYLSQPTRAPIVEEHAPKMGRLAQPKDYTAPTDVRDPFAQPLPPGSEVISPGAKKGGGEKKKGRAVIHIEAIFWDPEAPMVSINGRVLSEGEKTAKLQVVKIYPDRVVLLVDGKRVTRRLNQ